MRFVTITFLTAILFFTSLSNATTHKVPHDFAKIQSAINAAVNGDTVLVDEGTYFENILIKKKIVLGSLYLLDGDSSHISKTILDGSQPNNTDSASVILMTTGTDSTTIVSGFTIQRGRGTRIYDPTYWDASWWGGGGICIYAGGARISHNIIKNDTLNSFEGVFGGGIAVWIQDGPIEYWIIENNLICNNILSSTTTHGGAEGGGVHLTEDGRFVNNIVMNNSAVGTSYGLGGGIIVATAIGYGNTNILLANNYISGNLTSNWGGGLGAAIDPYKQCIPYLTFENNIICNNTAMVSGGAFHFQGGNYFFTNNTIVDNIGPQAIEVESVRGLLTMLLLNTIVWNPKTSTEVLAGSGTYAKNIAASYCTIRSGFPGTGNLRSDPLFVTKDSLYRLSDSSPCIGAGISSAPVGGVTLNAPLFDYFNTTRPRPSGTNPDMGAVENDRSSPTPVKEIDRTIPTSFTLEQNYPNPFNPSTTFRYALPSSVKVKLTIHDILGREIATLVNEEQSAGWKEVQWDASSVASGIYFYRLQAGKFVETKKMLLVR